MNLADLLAEYMFPLAHICNINAIEARDLRVSDFAVYVDSIDAYIAARKG